MADIYLVSGTLAHDGTDYADGAEFTCGDAALMEQLHRQKVLLLPEEYAAAAAAEGNPAAIRQLAQRRQDVQEQLAQAQARIAELEAAQQAQQTKGSK